MRSISILYQDFDSLRQQVLQENINPISTCLVRIYVSDMLPPEAVALAQEMQQLLPQAKIAGCSIGGVMYKDAQYPEGTLIVIDLCERTDVYVGTFTWGGKPAKVVSDEIAAALKDKNPQAAHIICAEHYPDVHNFVEEFNTWGSDIKLAGGVACDLLLKDSFLGFVFTPEGTVPQGMVVAAYLGEKLYSYSGVSTAHEPISPKYKLTDCEGGQWKSINGQETRQWLLEQLSVQTFQEHSVTDWEAIAENDILARFPMVLEGRGGASRFVRYDMDCEGITQYFSQIPKGTEFRIGYINPTECVRESFEICNEIMEQPIEALFGYTCLFRRLYLNNCAQWEISPYAGNNFCGAFMLGEIGHIDGKNQFLNGACCIMGIAENRVYIRPNMDVFQQLNKIEDESKDLLNMVLKKQQENTSKYNDQLLARLVSQQKTSKEQLYIDFNTGLNNYLKYKDDKKTFAFNKLCMIKIENFELLITHQGHEGYVQLIRKSSAMIEEFLKEMDERNLIHWYVFNESSLFIVADDRLSESHFIEISRRLFDKYRFMKPTKAEDVLINRFVVVLQQDELIEIALNAFQANKNMQVPFLICEQDDSIFSTEEEFKMIGVLNRALENDGVVPYFQGIYDNHQQRITKYEALMRIMDVDGTVYAPAQFMDIAKKYHLYPHLSDRMMRKVFTLFKGKGTMVTLNFSLFDINSPEMCKIIFDALDEIGDASNFILEILEDEEFKDIHVLKDFITRVRKYGVRIAIDDFGVGYSNLLEIASISPDYIKVDGSIIRSLHQNQTSHKLLDIIVYIGQQFGTEIVAEFVENQEIQDQVILGKIRHSQGYHFSRPQPFEAIFGTDASPTIK